MIKTEKKAAKAKATKVPRRTKHVLKGRPKRGLKAKHRWTESSFETPAQFEAGMTSRLEARITARVYQLIERAAMLRGLTVTAYVTAIMGEDARRTIEQTEIIRLSRVDQIAFAKALINPSTPTERLRRAAKRHAELIGD